MALKLITPPEPLLDLDTVKAHLLYDDDDQDTLIQTLIEVATNHIDGKDGWLNRALKPQTYDLVYDRFPCEAIQIPLPPLISVDSVNYVDEDGLENPFLSTSYVVDNVSQPGWVQLGSDFNWPDLMNTINAVRIRFTAGYPDESGPTSTVPKAIQHAVLMMVYDLFQHRGSVEDGRFAELPIPTTVKRLLAPFRVFA